METIDQTSQGDGTSATSSTPTPGIEPSMSHTLTNPHTGHKDHEPPTIHPREKTDENKGTLQCTFNRSHRDMAAISEHDHGVEETAQPNTPPQKPVPTPNKVQETGKEYIARPLVCGSIHLKNSGENKSPEFPYTPPDLSEEGDLTVQFVLRPKIM